LQASAQLESVLNLLSPILSKWVFAPTEDPTQVPTELTFKSFYISSKRIKPRDAGERARDGASPPCPFIKGAKGTAVPFMKISWVVVYQDRIEKIYCSYSRTQKLRTGFLYFLVILLRSTSLLNRNKHNW